MARKILEVEIRGKDGFSGPMKQAGLSAEQTARKMREINHSAASPSANGEDAGPKDLNDRLKEIGHSFGSRRALSHIVHGGIAGFIGQELAHAAEKIEEVSEKFREGKLDATGLVVEIGKGIPIIGGFVAAGQSIREMLTGEKHDIEEINQRSKLQNQIIEYRASLLEEEKKRLREIGDAITAINVRRAKAGATDFGRQQIDVAAGSQQRLRSIEEKRRDAIGAADKNAAKQIKTIDEQAAEGKLNGGEFLDAKQKIHAANRKNVAAINNEFDQQRIAEEEASSAERLDFQTKSLNAGVKLVEGHERIITDLESQARAERLKSLGLDQAAELLLIEANAKAKKKAIDEQIEEQKKTATPAVHQALEGQAKREKDAIDAEAAAQRIAAGFKDRQGIDQKLRQERESLLSQKASDAIGFRAQLDASRHLAEFKLKGALADQAKEYQRIMNDPNATGAQKKLAAENVRQFIDQSGRAFDKETIGDRPQIKNVATLAESSTLTGVAEAVGNRDESSKRLQRTTEEGVRVQKDLLTSFRQYLDDTRRNQGTGATITFGVTDTP